MSDRRNKWLIRVVSLLFAFLLFLNTTGTGRTFLNNRRSSNDTVTKTVKNVPVELKYDSDRYFVSGYVSTVTVKLASVNRVLLNTEEDEQTRSFSVVADLSGYKTGTYTVPLQVKGLSSGVTSTLGTEEIHVTIEKKVTKSFDVTAKLASSKLVKSGYTVSSLTTTPKKVSITSGKSTIKAIQQVVATVSGQAGSITKNQTVSADIVAYDKSGQQVDVESSPTSVKVQLVVAEQKKKVPIKLTQSGNQPSEVNSYRLTSNVSSIEVSGSESALAELSSLAVSVDISDITSETTRKVTLNFPDNVTSDTASITVTITPDVETASSSVSMSETTTTAGSVSSQAASSAQKQTDTSTTNESSTTETKSSSTTSSTSSETSETTSDQKE